jgi:sugar fermentation stimulation protein A
MLGLAEPGMAVWLSESDKPSRKLRYTWELVDAGPSLVGINTGRTNAIVAEALAAGRIGAFAGYARVRPEVRLGQKSRIDFLLEDDGRPPCYLEVKSVTLRRGSEAAEFPDAVTARGARHLEELATAAADGARAAMLFLVQRDDCRRLAVAGDIDPAYAAAFDRAQARGVEVVCYGCKVGPEAIELHTSLPLAETPGPLAGI